MAWVITKTLQKGDYYLLRATASGRALWTPNVNKAIAYSTEKAAKYVITVAKLKRCYVKQVVI